MNKNLDIFLSVEEDQIEEILEEQPSSKLLDEDQELEKSNQDRRLSIEIGVDTEYTNFQSSLF